MKVGTCVYMSPEMVMAKVSSTKEAYLQIDIYALAMLFWEMLRRTDIKPTGLPHIHLYLLLLDICSVRLSFIYSFIHSKLCIFLYVTIII